MNFKVENWKLLVLSVFYVIFAVISYMVKKEQFLNFEQNRSGTPFVRIARHL